MIRIRRAALAALLVVTVSGLAGCITSPGGIAPSNVPLDGREYTILGKAQGTDSAIRLFGFIPVSGSNDIRTAMHAAIHEANGDALIEITVEAYMQWWILFTRHATRVRGTAIRFEGGPPDQGF